MNFTENSNKQQSLLLYFQVHQPLRLAGFNFFTIGSEAPYFDDELNKQILLRVAEQCYLPANNLLLRRLQENPELKITFSISGSTLDQLNAVCPEVIESFKRLADTGCVEFLGETSHHSMASVMKSTEFEEQVLEHAKKLMDYFGVRPTAFRNTELIYNDEIGKKVADMGFCGILTDGIEKILNEQSTHHVYHHPENPDFKILLRNYRLSDDIAFRFTQSGTALTVDQYMSWLNQIPADHDIVTLAMDYETFGEHHKRETGIFTFLDNLMLRLSAQHKFKMVTATEGIQRTVAHTVLRVPQYISWADNERDLSAWLGNDMQRDAFDTVIKLEAKVKELQDESLRSTWRHLLTSDHFYYMSTKKMEDGNVHSYFSHYPSPYEAFINYMNILSDFSLRISKAHKRQEESYRDGASYEHDRRHQVVPEWAHKLENNHFHTA
jgi:alpha-amylase